MSRDLWADFPAGTIVSAEVAASVYRPHQLRPGHANKLLAHAARVLSEEPWLEPLCKRVKAESLLPDAAIFNEVPVECTACLSKLRRLKLPVPGQKAASHIDGNKS